MITDLVRWLNCSNCGEKSDELFKKSKLYDKLMILLKQAQHLKAEQHASAGQEKPS